MSTKTMIMGSLVLAGTLAPLGATAHAGNINTGGTACQNYNAAEALDIDYFMNAVRNINAAARPVVCNIARSPLPASTIPQFWVDGHNNMATCTSCTLFMYHAAGGIAAAQSFTQCTSEPTASNWHHVVTFPSLPNSVPSDYASLLCSLPGNGAGLLYGATAVQP